MIPRRALCALALLAACGAPEKPATDAVEQALSQQFAAGSLIIPMDNTYQDSGALKAFGLVDLLLRSGVPVSWAIASGKSSGGTDFTASATDVASGAAISHHPYKAGPFVVASADRAAALPLILAWQKANATAVHSATAGFSAEVRLKLTAAPRIGIFADGYEGIAFGYLNAAGIPDSAGHRWPTTNLDEYKGHPDVLIREAIQGPQTGGALDGALLNSDGTPAFCNLTSMHYDAPADEEVVREVRGWLTGRPVHAFMECQAAYSFENAANGKFLTTGGFQQNDYKFTPNPNTVLLPDSPFAQLDGSFFAVPGALGTIGLLSGSHYRAATALLDQASDALGTLSRAAWVTGFLDGDTANGKVSYLSGHEYSTWLPISASPTTNGVRFFLDSLLESPCVVAAGQASLSLTKSAPALVDGSSITFHLAWSNGGNGAAGNAVLGDILPAGTTFISATGGGKSTAGTVRWNLGNIAKGASGSVDLTVSVTADGSYSNRATLDYQESLTPRAVSSNTTVTVRNATPPHTTLLSTPASLTNLTTATFQIASDKIGSTFECSLDGAGFAACGSTFIGTGLSDGAHTFQARARDAAGTVDRTPASFSWTVDTVPPAPPLIDSPADSAFIASTKPMLAGSAEFGATVRVLVDGAPAGSAVSAAAIAASGRWMVTLARPLAEGPHTLSATATDGANNESAPGTSSFIVDTTPPTTSITSGPGQLGADRTATFTFAASEAATFECSLENAAFAPCNTPFAVSSLPLGDHQLLVRARDRAGNVDPNPASYLWRILADVRFRGGGCASAGQTGAWALLGIALFRRRRH